MDSLKNSTFKQLAVAKSSQRKLLNINFYCELITVLILPIMLILTFILTVFEKKMFSKQRCKKMAVAFLATFVVLSNAFAGATSTTTRVKLKGVNLAGAEYNAEKPYARLNWDFTYPNNAEIDYYASRGMTTIRLPFSGARVQQVNNAALNATEISYIKQVVLYCASKGMTVILDPHDFGMKYDSVSATMKIIGVPNGIPASHFADFWSRMATEFRSHPNVIFGLMNEPHFQTPKEWKAVATLAVTAIRATGATQKILIPGSAWSSAITWVTSGNAAAWTGFVDPANNFAFEVHQYLDSNGSGKSDVCVLGKGKNALNQATIWARTNRYELFLGEAGWAQNATCLNEGAAMMNYTSANPDVWIGWTYWAGGKWWAPTYIFLLRPLDLVNPVDRPQMWALLNNLQ